MAEDDNTASSLVLEGALTLRCAEELRATLVTALAGPAPLTIDCGGASDVDLSFVQLLIATHRSAAQSGARVALATPPSGPLLNVLIRAGFAVTRHDLADQVSTFWFEGAVT